MMDWWIGGGLITRPPLLAFPCSRNAYSQSVRPSQGKRGREHPITPLHRTTTDQTFFFTSRISLFLSRSVFICVNGSRSLSSVGVEQYYRIV